MKQEKNDPAEPRRGGIIAWVSAIVCVCIALLAVTPLMQPIPVGAAGRLSEPTYPAMPQYPSYEDYGDDYDAYSAAYEEWLQGLHAQRDCPADFSAGLNAFCQRTATEFLTGAEGKNCVYSPANVYMALAMLAEVTDGASREQLLSLLGAADIEALRTQAGQLWNVSYCDDGALTSVLANSLWLSETISYEQETIDRLASEYYASSFRGAMGSEAYDAMLQDWINEQTGGLLKEQASELTMPSETVLALASTVYFKAGWREKFDGTRTAQEIFTTPDGEVTVDFMRKTVTNGILFWGNAYTAVREELEGDCAMWLILPDEGIDLDVILRDGEALRMTQSGADAPWEQQKRATVELAMPKFDVDSTRDLAGGLKTLGVTDVFDPSVSDFSPLTGEVQNLWIDKAEHAARVMVDEEGCTAAAYTVLMIEATAALPEENETVYFTLDRPFLFIITGSAQQPLFMGVVNQP